MPSTSDNTGGPALDGLLATTNEDNKPLWKDRLKTVSQAYNAYKAMRDGDRQSALNRLLWQYVLDGGLPYSQAELTRRGLAEIANINFGFFEDALSAAAEPYNDIIEASEVLMRMPLKTSYGDEQTRAEAQAVIEEEYTSLVTLDEGFDYRFAELVRQFLLQGTGIPYWENTLGITWMTSETGNFLLPRDVRASEDAVEIACAVREYMPHELARHLSDEGEAKKSGWRPKEVWRAIRAAQPSTDYEDDYEKWQQEWKDNDLGSSYQGKPSVIRVVHQWVKGLDGKVTHQMFLADGSSQDFLFKHPDRFKTLSEAFTIFTDGVGTNGKFHGIRGLGYKIYAVVKEMNELWSGFIDAIRQSGKLFIQPKNEAARKNLALVEFGHYIVLPPNTDFINREIPNYGQNIIPGLNLLDQILRKKTGSYTTQSAFDSSKEQTRAEIMARLDEITKLSLGKMNIFYKSWTRLNREQIRRVKRVDWVESDPDYRKVMQFYDACEARGVPKEAIYAIDLRRVRAVKAAGAGSPQARSAMFERLTPLSTQYDAQGKQNFLRDMTMAIAGKEKADSYVPKVPGLRPPQDKKIADMENGLMASGQVQMVEPNENHPVHVIEHLTGPGGLLELVQAYEAGQVGLEAIPRMRLLHDHCDGNEETGEQGHMQYIPEVGPDGRPNMERAGFKEALQQSSEVLWNGEKKLMAEQQKLAEQQQQPEVEQAGIGATESRAVDQAEEALVKVETDAAAKKALTAQELAQREERWQQEKRHNEEKFRQQQELEKAKADIETANKLLTQPSPSEAAA